MQPHQKAINIHARTQTLEKLGPKGRLCLEQVCHAWQSARLMQDKKKIREESCKGGPKEKESRDGGQDYGLVRLQGNWK